MAADDKGDMKVKLAKAAVTNRNVSSPPFMRESPKKTTKGLKTIVRKREEKLEKEI